MSKLIVISAPSGAGKTTLCGRLLQDFPDLVLSISFTTRAPRGQEVSGREYHFLSREDFQKRLKEGEFVEWAEVHGNFYGTSKQTILDSFARGKSVLLDIDVQGAESLRRAFGEKCFSIFIAPPSMEALEARLRSRGTDPEATIQKRLLNAKMELQEAPKFSRTVVNDELERAYSELKSLVQELCRS